MTASPVRPAVAPTPAAVLDARTLRPRGPAASHFDFDVGIVGLGYVGLPTALSYATAGQRVLGLEISDARLRAIRRRDVDLTPSDHERLEATLPQAERFHLTSDPAELARARAVIVCVPTPVDQFRVPDLAPLLAASRTAVAHARRGQLLMLTSTTYVGCTRDFLVKPLEARGLAVGRDVFAAFSPERIDPGNTTAHESVPRIVGGATPECSARAARVIGRSTRLVHRAGSLEVAEMAKLLENSFRAVNIALANEFADAARALGVDVTEVIDAASTKPYGFMPFSPGPGVGGHCIPCDPHYLLWQLRRNRVSTPMLAQAMEDIAARPTQVIERAREVLSDAGRGLVGARILVVGVAYKPGVADLRESPALEILEGLDQRGAIVGYLDHHFEHLDLDRLHLDGADPARFRPDLVILHTRHQDEDLGWIDEDQLVLDTTYRAREFAGRVTL